jgi:ribosomal protein S18 acetylase RimI-like enzyme
MASHLSWSAAMNQPPTSAAMNIRPVRPDDTLLMQTFLQGLGDESRRHRFHGAVNACSSGLLRLMTCVDGSRHVAWVVVGMAPGGLRLLGEARFFRSASGEEAEMALAVADDCRGHGVADRLMQTLVAAAGARGVQQLRAEVELSNQRMRAFVQRHGFAETQAAVDAESGVLTLMRSVPNLRRRRLH